jgi:isopenicillin-N epimerase
MPSSSFAPLWTLDPGVEFLNHGSFGAAPRAVLEAQSEWRARLERQPLQFFRELERHLDAARDALGAFVGADPDDLAFVSNATSGVNTVVRSLQLQPGDELLTTDHVYNACRNALRLHEPRGVRVVVAQVPFPLRAPGQVIEAVLAKATPRTRLVLLDHVTSPTGLVFPVAELVRALGERGIDTLVDGAHAPGMVPLDLRTLGAAYYTGNCHKWLCAPKGSAFLHVRRDRQDGMLPLTIGHGFNSTRADRSRFRLLFDWTGTADPTPFLCIPAALACVGSLLPGGWPELMRRNRALALSAQGILSEALGIGRPAPSEMIGSLAAVPLPPLATAEVAAPPAPPDPLQRALLSRHRIEVPVMPFPAPPARVVRVAAQVYNSEEQVHALAAALRALLAETPRG